MIPNFECVTGKVWRGARPDAKQAKWLVAQGICTVLNLEWEQTDDEVFAEVQPGPTLIRVKDFEPLPWFAPSIEDQHVVEVLARIRNAQPITYIHCKKGENRTGVIIAAYELLELNDPLSITLYNFNKYRGFWAWGDIRYIKSLKTRRADLLSRITNLARVR